MVSTRSHSVLSADGAPGDTAATAGEVSSAAPTPRRSGRLSRGAATPTAAAAAAKAPPASARAARSRRPLKAIAEEQEQAADAQQAAAQQQQEQQEQEQEGAGEHAAAPRARRRSGTAATAAATAPAQQQEEAEGATAEATAGEGGSDAAAAAGQAEPLKANAAVVDLLAQQMFAALDGAFGAGAGGSSSSSESDSESEPEPAAQAAAGQQQQHQGQQPAADAGNGSSDEGSDSEGEGQGHHVPAHLRWRPELTLPGMGPSQQRQRGGSTQAAPAAAAAAAPSVHVVRRGGKDSLHVPPPDERAQARAARKTAPDTAGKGWFDLPATKITDEVKSDLRMLRLRGALDPKAHYKKLDGTKFPKYFQMGTVVEGAADYYSGRLTNKQRKRTLTEEIMADEGLTQVRKKRYNKLQEERSYWAKKKPGRKTENERRKKAHHRPKH